MPSPRIRIHGQAWRTAAATAVALFPLVLMLLIALSQSRKRHAEPSPSQPRGDEIVVAGERMPTGTPVVLWSDPGGYNAYLETSFFAPPDSDEEGRRFRRYRPRRTEDPDLRARVEAEGWTLRNLREHVRLFVIHYDVCVVSRRCFTVLHDSRGLSVHFMLDLDGTIYQTLDVAESALHAGNANNASIGIEIAHIGAYPDAAVPDRWYQPDETGRLRVVLPPDWGDGGIRTPGFIARPARAGLITGKIHGRPLVQYDFTDAQYEALARLAAALSHALPRIRLDVPRDADGGIYPTVLSREELGAFEGLLGHLHLTRNKIDPGPAFDWERVLRTARTFHATMKGARAPTRR